jgi:hypothetical protein
LSGPPHENKSPKFFSRVCARIWLRRPQRFHVSTVFLHSRTKEKCANLKRRLAEAEFERGHFPLSLVLVFEQFLGAAETCQKSTRTVLRKRFYTKTNFQHSVRLTNVLVMGVDLFFQIASK